MSNQTYNGWTNYATWRVNLEFFDGITEAFDAETCKELVEEHLDDNANGLALDYANAFISEVNWREIANHLNED